MHAQALVTNCVFKEIVRKFNAHRPLQCLHNSNVEFLNDNLSQFFSILYLRLS